MISVKKIAHATYEVPDLDKQVEYYTEILGLAVTGKDKDSVYLASTVDHHSIVLRKGPAAQCLRIGFQLGPDDDLEGFAKQTEAHGIKVTRQKDPEPGVAELVSFADPKGTVMEVFKPTAPVAHKFNNKGVVPHKLGHVAFHVTDVKQVTKFYCDVLGGHLCRCTGYTGIVAAVLAAAGRSGSR